MDLFYDEVIIACVIFIGWWPWYCERQLHKQAAMEECKQCGRMVLAIELHIKHCTGRPGRVKWDSRIKRVFRMNEMRETVGPEPRPRNNNDDLEEL